MRRRGDKAAAPDGWDRIEPRRAGRVRLVGTVGSMVSMGGAAIGRVAGREGKSGARKNREVPLLPSFYAAKAGVHPWSIGRWLLAARRLARLPASSRR